MKLNVWQVNCPVWQSCTREKMEQIFPSGDGGDKKQSINIGLRFISWTQTGLQCGDTVSWLLPVIYLCVHPCLFVVPQAMSVCKHIWSDMEAVSAVNATQDEFQLLPLPDDDPGNRGYPDYDPNVGANAPASPTLMFEGVFPEDPIKQLSVQVEVSYCSSSCQQVSLQTSWCCFLTRRVDSVANSQTSSKVNKHGSTHLV